MISITVLNEFKVGLEGLLDRLDRISSPQATQPFLGSGVASQLEANTRVNFFDDFLKLLGWDLGPIGDVAQEARVKSETTNFVDYLGVCANTRAPKLLFEAKRWDKAPIIGQSDMKKEALIGAVRHLNEGKDASTSPVSAAWHDDLDQVRRYVDTFKNEYGHEIPRAVLSSGQWIVIFKDPNETFIKKAVDPSNLYIFEKSEFLEHAEDLLSLLHRENIVKISPLTMRSSQIRDYVESSHVEHVFHSVLIRYHQVGASVFSPKPQMQIYPALILQCKVGAIFTVVDDEDGIPFAPPPEGEYEDSVSKTMEEIGRLAEELINSNNAELGIDFPVSSVVEFQGFPENQASDFVESYWPIRIIKGTSNEWVLVTGNVPHILHTKPALSCKYNSWANCKSIGQAAESFAISTPQTEKPKSFFTDGQPHHCAHQTVLDRRKKRCIIDAIDQRTCCQTCAFINVCWKPTELADLPCGQ